jgi:hypothetical protein
MIESVIKTCQNCAYRKGGFTSLGVCLRTGYLCKVMRMHPGGVCDENFSGWAERQKPWIQRLLGL